MSIESPARTMMSGRIAEFGAALEYGDIPAEVLERARHLVLDAVGLAFASTAYGFPAVARDALSALSAGDHPVLAMPDRLDPRDAAVLNGVLIHGMDFDDTHIPAVTHVTAAALPAALSAATTAGATTRDLLTAYVLGVEVSARVGLGGAGGFHDVGFHPTAVAGAFGAAVAAGKLAGLDADRLVAAQGIVGSMSAGLLEFLEDGSWTKRQHPGWAAMCGITAASFARFGWSGPPAVYEGRFGLFNTHLAGRETDPGALGAGLGTQWELMRTAVKPYPICHFIHAFADAVLDLRAEHGLRPADIAAVRCAIHPVPGKVVCEPAEAKWAPRDEYDAKFSLPYVVSAALSRGRFGLAELEDEALHDTEILDLARRVSVSPDDESAFPRAYSGYVEIELTDGRVLTRREQVNRGHDERPLTNAEIAEKFAGSMALVTDEATTERVRTAILGLGDDTPARDFAEACRGV
ncbi:MmgE/PrpD family protein [Pseudonocardia benzenivorans]|uniref:MmgE/PrpD family protein n=2 Tax=Pseudonocardia TaxID=1847 RepID=F2L6U7_PSEUX|nr:MmgE/PrpD family protein [Pseudonocardia dioxanivorans]AEA28305.1 MmgE/PrpD family protein [Pseudonocardia dioxanivorans CB1190]AEA28819.1 MmgE/PrpD family protein [Pseudonocardia dioxanivorans CB1190]